MFHLICVALVIQIQLLPAFSQPRSKIDPNLMQELQKDNKVDVVVSFHNGIRNVLSKAKVTSYSNRASRTTDIKDELVKNAERSQEGVISMLSSKQSDDTGSGYKYFTKFWINNKLFIKDANLATVISVVGDPQVVRIQKEPILRLPIAPNETSEVTSRKYEPKDFWNLPLIQVPEAWAELGGNKGEGVVVANIDTGVWLEHATLKNNFRGEYGWLDPVNGSVIPEGSHYHGTTTMSILAGGTNGENGTAIGVAPGVKWMACRGCSAEYCEYEAILKCIQFMGCPTLADGSNEDCSKAPHVLSHSIVTSREEPAEELAEFKALHQMGIIIVAGIGNEGIYCDNSWYPANSEFVIGVGATGPDDDLYDFSSKGPTPDGRIKPDLVAPGLDIIAASLPWKFRPSPLELIRVRGTSYATPHVAGVVALLHVRDPEITFETVFKLLTQNTDRNITWNHGDTVGIICGNLTLKEFPNHVFGWGRLNALKIVQAQTKLLNGTSIA